MHFIYKIAASPANFVARRTPPPSRLVVRSAAGGYVECENKVSPYPKGRSSKWKEVPSKESLIDKYHAEGSLAVNDYNKGHLELRTLLDEPLAQAAIGEFAKSKFTQESFFAWTEIQEYRHIPTSDYRHCNILHIYEKYVKEGAVCEVGSISEDVSGW